MLFGRVVSPALSAGVVSSALIFVFSRSVFSFCEIFPFTSQLLALVSSAPLLPFWADAPVLGLSLPVASPEFEASLVMISAASWLSLLVVSSDPLGVTPALVLSLLVVSPDPVGVTPALVLSLLVVSP